MRMEVYVFADLGSDGRFSLEEGTLMPEGSDADRTVASAR